MNRRPFSHRNNGLAILLVCFLAVTLLNGLFLAIMGDDAPGTHQKKVAWPETWTVYANLKETDVDLASLRQLPQTINGTAAQPMPFINGTLSLLQPGEKPIVKRPGFIFGTIHSDSNQTIPIGCSANWWMECRLNGVVLLDTLQAGEVRSADQRILQLPLKQGDNLLAFKVLSGKGGWSLTLIPPSEAAKAAVVPFRDDADNPLVDTDFQDAATGSYDSGKIIGSGSDSLHLTAFQLYKVSKINIDAGADKKHYLAFTSDNTTTLTHPTCAAIKIIPYNYSIQNNLSIKSSVAFSPQNVPPGATQGNVDVMVMSTTLSILKAPCQIAFINLRPSFLQSHTTAGKHYRIDLSIDCSDPLQHTWQWSLYEQGNPTALYASGPQKTRDPVGQPAYFAVTGSGTPYLAIEHVQLSAAILKDKPTPKTP